MRFEAAYKGWTEKRLSQREAAEILGVCDRTFRRYVHRFEGDGVEGLIDYCLGQASHRRAPVDDVIALTTLYTTRYHGWNWNVQHPSVGTGGVLGLDRDHGRCHQKYHFMPPMFFVEQKGTASSFRGVREVMEQKGLFCSFNSDRGRQGVLTQFGRALKQLSIEQIAAYSPEARGARSACSAPTRNAG